MVDKKHQWSREEIIRDIRLDSGHRRDLQAVQHIAPHTHGGRDSQRPVLRDWTGTQDSKTQTKKMLQENDNLSV